MKNLRKRIKTKKGITLVALIITVIVLLILAGVVISMTVGNDGIIGKAQGAVDAYKNAQEKEEQVLNQAGDYMNGKFTATVGSQSGQTGTVNDNDIIEDYTTNMLYRTDYTTMENGQNGVTIPSNGVTINTSGNYAVLDGSSYITIAHDTIDPDDELAGTTDKTITCWYKINSAQDTGIMAIYGELGIGTSVRFAF